MLIALKQFELNGVLVRKGQQVNPRLPPALLRRLVSTKRLKRVEGTVPTEVFARRPFTYEGRTVKPGEKIANLTDEKRGVLLRTNYVEERETAEPKKKTAKPRKRTRKG